MLSERQQPNLGRSDCPLIIHDFYEKIGRFRFLAPSLDISSEAKDYF